MDLSINLKSRYGKDLGPVLIDKNLEFSDFSSSFQSRSKNVLADISASMKIQDRSKVELRRMAFAKYLEINGTLDDLPPFVAHKSQENVSKHRELLEKHELIVGNKLVGSHLINKANIPLNQRLMSFEYTRYENMISKSENDHVFDIGYYLGIISHDLIEQVDFRVETPVAFKFSEEMLQAFHDSLDFFVKEVYPRFSVIDRKSIKTMTVRDAAEFSALFLYVFWDDLNPVERKYVVSAIMTPTFISINSLLSLELSSAYSSERVIASRQKDSNLHNYMFMVNWMTTIFEFHANDIKHVADNFLQDIFKYTDEDHFSIFSQCVLKIIDGAYKGKNNVIEYVEETLKYGNSRIFSYIAPLINTNVYGVDFKYTEKLFDSNINHIHELIRFARECYSCETSIKWIKSGKTVVEAEEFFSVGITDPSQLSGNETLESTWVSAWNE